MLCCQNIIDIFSNRIKLEFFNRKTIEMKFQIKNLQMKLQYPKFFDIFKDSSTNFFIQNILLIKY